MAENPFKPGSAQHRDFETMRDLKWHCTKCELKSGQAKTWQLWRQEYGLQIARDENGHWYKKIFCEHCGKITVHRRLVSEETVMSSLKVRSDIPGKLIKRIKKIYGCTDEYTLRTEPFDKLEIDHRVPQVRWSGNEGINDISMPEEQIREKFMLLTRENNLLKSRVCESCVRTGIRGKGYKVIEYWYIGDENYTAEIGCTGCFWHNPSKWREFLNEKIKKIKNQ